MTRLWQVYRIRDNRLCATFTTLQTAKVYVADLPRLEYEIVEIGYTSIPYTKPVKDETND